MQIPILAGTYVDSNASLRVALPVNMVPVPGQGSAAAGYMRPAEGVLPFATGEGADRGGIVWPVTGLHYRVSGGSLITVSATGAVAILGAIGGSGPVRMDYSFTLLGILADGLLYFWDNINLTIVTDVNVPANLTDMVWIDSYWMVTDGAIVATSNLAAPTTFNANKYTGLNNPDTIQALHKVQGQAQIVSKNEIDVFQNVGGQGFPFSFVQSAIITKGSVGARASCAFQSTIGGVIVGTVAFVGSGRDEAPSVYLGVNAQAIRIATAEIDELLLSYTPAQLATIILEAIVYRGAQFLHVRLPDRTVVYDAIASAAAQEPVWHTRVTAIVGFSQCRSSFATLAYGAWIVGDPQSSALGVLSTSDSSHWGSVNRWELATSMIRNDGKSANISQLELVCLNGVVPNGVDPRVSTSYSVDGVNWSVDKSVKSGKLGDRTKRLVWFGQGAWRNYRIQRFRGDSNSRLSALRVDAELEPLGY